ncbi:MAG: hypothetical protein LBG15_12255 [Dysgonamonadaceae bacterium]|jgi:hypothetical protein|nr:hypothetical protein [Dysgonamonadaceae bacterium]
MKSLSIVFAFFLFSCSKTESLKKALEQAEDNRHGLQKVLEYYKQEPLKLKVAEFLISYMGYNKFSYKGEIITHYDTLFSVHDSFKYRAGVIVGDPTIIRQTWEAVIKSYGRINLSSLQKVYDCRNIK